MPKIKEPVTTKADEKTQEYIMGLMKDLPHKLFQSVTELRDMTAAIRAKLDTLDQDVHVFTRVLAEDLEKLAVRLGMLEKIVAELCGLASMGTAIEPMWTLLQKKQIDSSEKDE